MTRQYQFYFQIIGCFTEISVVAPTVTPIKVVLHALIFITQICLNTGPLICFYSRLQPRPAEVFQKERQTDHEVFTFLLAYS